MAQGRKTLQEVRAAIQKYCAAQERCHNEVRSKLLTMHVYGDDLEGIMSDLITEGFLNEERYARSYARGQFRINSWGRIKIKHGLRAKRVPERIIQQGLDEIDEEEYLACLDTLLKKQLRGGTTFPERQKAVVALQRKGYETELILSRIKNIASPDSE